MKKGWSKKERRVLREQGAKLSPESLAKKLGRPPLEVREALESMGVQSVPALGPSKGIYPEGILFAVFLLLLAVIPLAYSPVTKDNFLLPKLLILQPISAAALCIWLLGLSIRGESRLRRNPATLYLGLLIVSLLPSFARSANLLLSFDSFIFLTTCALLWFLAGSFSLTPGRRRAVVGVIIAAACMEASYGALQYLGIDPLFRAPDIERLSVFGTFGNPNFLAGYLAACLPVALSSFLTSRRPVTLIAAGCSLALVALGILLTGTKGAMLAGAISSIFILSYTLIHGRLRRATRLNFLILGLILVLLLAALFLLSTLGKGAFDIPSTVIRSLDTRGLSVGKRILYWKSTAQMIVEHPFLGWGLGTFRLHYIDHQGGVLADPNNTPLIPLAGNPLYAHNDYLHLWAESGVFSLAFFLLLIYVILRQGIQNTAKTGTPLFLLGFMGGVISILVQSWVSFPLHRPTTSLIFWSFAALAAAEPEKGNGWLRVRVPRPLSLIFLLAALTVFAFTTSFSVRRYRADTLFARGYAAAAAKQWKNSIYYYGRGLTLYRRDGEALINRGIAYYHLGLRVNAIGSIEQGFREARDFHGHLVLADALDENNDFTAARKAYEELILLRPGDARALNNMGVCVYKRNRVDEAISLWERAVETDPLHQDSLANLVVTYHKRGDTAEARRWAEKLIAADPDEANRKKARLIIDGPSPAQ